MRSLNKAIVGMLVAAAMIAGPFATAASADETAEPQIQTSTGEAATSTEDPKAGSVAGSGSQSAASSSDTSQSGDSKESKTEAAEKNAVGEDKAAAPSQQSSHPAQSVPDSQAAQHAQPQGESNVVEEGDWGGDSAGQNKVHWSLRQEDDGYVMHVGPGVFAVDDEPWGPNTTAYSDQHKSNIEKMVGLVFDNPTHTFFSSDPQSSIGFGFLPELRYIQGVGDLNGGRPIAQAVMQQEFANDPKLETLDLSGWDTSQVTDMWEMFMNDNALKRIDGLSNWDTSQVTDMADMFSYDHALCDLDGIFGWNVEKLKFVNQMFLECRSLTKLDLSRWNTASLTGQMPYVFSDLSSLTYLDVSGWDVSRIDWMNGTFMNIPHITEIKGISTWRVKACNTNLSQMFAYDVNLTSLDLVDWDVSGVTSMREMFRCDFALASVTGLESWNTGRVTNISLMFDEDEQLDSLDLSGWDTGNAVEGKRAFPFTLKQIALGPKTRLNASFFSYREPQNAGAEEWHGYTGRWTSKDGNWVSDASQGDNESLSALTCDSGFTGGIFRWQVFAEVVFEKNAPAGVNVSGDDFKIREVGPDAAGIQITVPRLMYHAKIQKFLGWNTKADGSGTPYRKNNVVTGFTAPGQQVKLYAQWKSRIPPYTIHYEARPPAGLTATGATPDDVFTVTPGEGIDLLHYKRQLAQNGYEVPGYKFLCWRTLPYDHGGYYKENSYIRVAPGTTTVYAVWAKIIPIQIAPLPPVKPLPNPLPTPSPSPGPSPSPAPNPNPSPSPEPSPSPTPTPTPSPSPSPSPEPSPSPAPSPAPTPSPSPAPNPSPAPTAPTVVPQSVAPPAPTLPAAPPALAPAPLIGAAANAGAPAPATAPAPAQQQPQQTQPARPKCIPEDVYRRMQDAKGSTKPADWIEPDGSAYAQPAAWSLSDYNGLTRCEVEASAPSGMVRHFNFWWMLVFLVPLFLLMLAYRNGGYIVARHRDFDSATIKK